MSDSADLASTTTLIENRISRPPNAFMLYGKEYRSKLAKKHPNMSNKEISKILGKEWQAMDPEEKQRYHDMARATKNAHMEQNPDYVYSPLVARQKKAERKRVSQERRQLEDLTSMLSEFEGSQLPIVVTDVFIPPPEYSDVQMKGPYEKFVHFNGQLIPWKEWERVNNSKVQTKAVESLKSPSPPEDPKETVTITIRIAKDDQVAEEEAQQNNQQAEVAPEAFEKVSVLPIVDQDTVDEWMNIVSEGDQFSIEFVSSDDHLDAFE